jgi:hypothetical protein
VSIFGPVLGKVLVDMHLEPAFAGGETWFADFHRRARNSVARLKVY